MGQGEGANQPTKGLCAPLTYSHMTRGFGAPHLGFPPPGLGAKSPKGEIPSALAAAPLGETLGRLPLPFPLYIVEVLGLHNTRVSLSPKAQPYLSPSSSLVVLGEALLEYCAPPPPPRRRAAAGRSLPQPLPLSLLDQGTGDRAARVLNTEAPLFGA